MEEQHAWEGAAGRSRQPLQNPAASAKTIRLPARTKGAAARAWQAQCRQLNQGQRRKLHLCWFGQHWALYATANCQARMPCWSRWGAAGMMAGSPAHVLFSLPAGDPVAAGAHLTPEACAFVIRATNATLYAQIQADFVPAMRGVLLLALASPLALKAIHGDRFHVELSRYVWGLDTAWLPLPACSECCVFDAGFFAQSRYGMCPNVVLCHLCGSHSLQWAGVRAAGGPLTGDAYGPRLCCGGWGEGWACPPPTGKKSWPTGAHYILRAVCQHL